MKSNHKVAKRIFIGIFVTVVGGIILHFILGDNPKIYQNITNNQGEQTITNIVGDLNINNIIINDDAKQSFSTSNQGLIVKDITIHEIQSIEGLYKLYSLAKIEFLINNTLNVPYNLSVDWIYRNGSSYIRFPGKSITSTDSYKRWQSNRSVGRSGDWVAEVNVEYMNNNTMNKKEGLIEFMVA